MPVTTTVMTLVCILSPTGELLLGVKKRKVGVGKRMMPGGKKEAAQATLEACATDETRVETGLIVADLEHRGVIVITHEDSPEEKLQVHIYVTERYHGTLTNSDELDDLRWFPTDKLPWTQMLAADSLWLPQVLEGRPVWMRFTYNHFGIIVDYGDIHPFPLPR